MSTRAVETRREQMRVEEMAQKLNDVIKVLKEEDPGVGTVNVARLLRRLQEVTNYKEH